jgi:hypothetical protein
MPCGISPAAGGRAGAAVPARRETNDGHAPKAVHVPVSPVWP